MHLVLQILEATTQVTGPDHYCEGEGCLRASDRLRDDDPAAATHEAAMAQAHFLAALVALHAAEKQPESIRWQEAIGE